MPELDFNEVWEAVKNLTPEQMLRVRSLLDSLLARQGEPMTKERELEQLLLRDGLISRIPPPVPATQRDNWKPVEIKGKPLSETVIEERR